MTLVFYFLYISCGVYGMQVKTAYLADCKTHFIVHNDPVKNIKIVLKRIIHIEICTALSYVPTKIFASTLYGCKVGSYPKSLIQIQ